MSLKTGKPSGIPQALVLRPNAFGVGGLVSVSPPGRTHSQHILSHTAHKIALNRDHIERALFPRLVSVEGQAAVLRPHEYDPPPDYVMWDERPKGAVKSVAKRRTPPWFA